METSRMDRENPVDALGVLRERASELEHWLRECAPEAERQQVHLNEGTVARAYWNYGYLVALREVLDTMNNGQQTPAQLLSPL
jgi:hypothetical protein